MIRPTLYRLAAFTLALFLAACTPRPQAVVMPPSSPEVQPTAAPTLTPVPTAQEAAAMAAQRVQANQGWQTTYLFIHPGDKLDVTASGAWSHAPSEAAFGPGGVNRTDPDALLASAPLGSLLGRIGDNPPFLIGEHLTLTSEQQGELWFSINERPDQLLDNSGWLAVTIGFAAKPEIPGEHLLNELDRYRLVYPNQYYVVLRDGGVCFTLSSAVSGACDRKGTASLQVTEAQGQTAEQIADRLAPPTDLNIQMERIPMTVDGTPALRLDGRIAGDSWRLVIVLYRDRVYIWKFGPWTETPGLIDEYAELERLYDTLMSSFQFLD